MKITFEDSPPLVELRYLNQGDCFISARPSSDQVYMITEYSRRTSINLSAVSLKNGRYYHFKPEYMGQRVACEVRVTLRNHPDPERY